jgi:hypothetical protein
MWISSDGLMLLFQSDRPRGTGYVEIYMTTRATTNDDWSEPIKLEPPVNLTSDISPIVSSDGRTLYFSSYNRDGGYGYWDLWQVPIIPLVDLNGDGIVDSADVVIMVDNWGTESSLCDIGPMPWGDGIVDVQDLVLLSEYFFKEINDPTLIAHWALDETEGMFAEDSVSEKDAYIIGGAVLQPDGGQVNGALQLNGVDGCVVTEPIMNPADGPFSVLAWIKGGAPAQVVVSQQFVSNWLSLDTEGNLMTELKSSDQLAGPLHSETVITDGQWHRIGFVWDGLSRKLYIDGILVAEDTQDSLKGSDSGLYIGCGKNMQPGTYWSGLIDDVRIYNRVVSP